MQIACPSCRSKLNIPDDAAGKITCPACRKPFVLSRDAEPKKTAGAAPAPAPQAQGPAPQAAPKAPGPAPQAAPQTRAVQATCPGCNRKLNVPESAVGRTVVCPACKGPVKVEEGPKPAAEEGDSSAASKSSSGRYGRSDRKGRRGKGKKSKKKQKKRIDVMPILLVGLLVLVGIGVALYFPMQKKTLRRAVSAGDRLGFDAAYAISRSPGEIGSLCSIVETSASGRMAAAGALALIARKSAPTQMVATIQSRLKETLSPEARAAYAAALAQSRRKVGEEAAAALASDGNSSVRLAVVRGLAHGKTDAGTGAIGRALGDGDPEVLKAAKGALSDWAVTSPEKAAEASAAALELDSGEAHVAAARVMLAVSGSLRPAQVLPLLTSDSAQVRQLGLEVLAANSSLVSSGGGEIEDAVVALLDPHAQPAGVKLAALDVVSIARMDAGGPKALVILKEDPDTATRGRAASTVAATQPEGAWAALTQPLIQDDVPRDLRIACLDVMPSMGAAPEEELAVVAGAVLGLAEGEDETIAGLALAAMRQIADRPGVKYGVKQWKPWLARRLYEIRAFNKTKRLFERMKEEYEDYKASNKKDEAEFKRIWKTIENAGIEFNEKVIKRADSEDSGPMKDYLSSMVRFNKKIRGMLK